MQKRSRRLCLQFLLFLFFQLFCIFSASAKSPARVKEKPPEKEAFSSHPFGVSLGFNPVLIFASGAQVMVSYQFHRQIELLLRYDQIGDTLILPIDFKDETSHLFSAGLRFNMNDPAKSDEIWIPYVAFTSGFDWRGASGNERQNSFNPPPDHQGFWLPVIATLGIDLKLQDWIRLYAASDLAFRLRPDLAPYINPQLILGMHMMF